MIKRKQTNWLKPMVVFGIGMFLTLTPMMSSYAASRKAITSVSLTINAEIVPDTDIGSEHIEIDTRSSNYSVDDYMVSNKGSVWDSDMVPEIQVTLTAGENYYFKSIPKSKISIRGDGEVTKGTIKDSSSTMILTVRFPSLKTVVTEIEEVKLSEAGIATWKAVANAGTYEILFYKNGIATVTPVVSNSNSFNCRPRLGKGSGSYHLKVRAVSAHDKTSKGKWTESNSIYVDKEKAGEFRRYPDGGIGSWKQTNDGRYWYERADGTYPQNAWEELSGRWYYFDESGYMKTGWIDWEGRSYYCTESGEMLKDAETPDGQRVGSDGAKIEKSAVTGAKEEDPDEAMRKEWAQLQGDETEDEDDESSSGS